jgi:hypothetical protein
MTEVIVAHEKHGTFTYATAVGLLKRRLDEGYWYYDDDANAAFKALQGGEQTAWEFLESRSDHEYEYVELQEVR